MRILLLAMFLSACAGDASGPATCTGKPYDVCAEEHDCEGMLCRPFGEVIACTQACVIGDNTTCPKQDGVEVECNAAALCAPTKNNTCILAILDPGTI